MTATWHQAPRTPGTTGMTGGRHRAKAPGLGGTETREVHKVTTPEGGWSLRYFI